MANFLNLTCGMVNIDNITHYQGDIIYFVGGTTAVMRGFDRQTLEEAINVPSKTTTASTTSTASASSSMEFYKKLVSKITEINKKKYYKYRITVSGDKIILSQDDMRSINEYTFDGLCISKGLHEDEVDDAVGSSLM